MFAVTLNMALNLYFHEPVYFIACSCLICCQVAEHIIPLRGEEAPSCTLQYNPLPLPLSRGKYK